MFHDADAQSPFERRPTFGFRCMLQREALTPRSPRDTTFERDPSTRKPVADEVYRAYRRLYDYDPFPLDLRVNR